MRKFVIVLAILILFWMWFDQSQKAEINSVEKFENQIHTITEVKEVEDLRSVSVEVKLTPKSLNLPDGQLFHEDILIDTLSGLNHFAPCHLYFSDQPRDLAQLATINSQQKKYLSPFFAACENEQEQFEKYNKNQIMIKLASTGKILKERQNTFLHDPAGVKFQVRQADGYELILAPKIYEDYFSTVIFPEVKIMLNAQNSGMLNLVIDEAMLLIACDSGVDCSYVSGLMMSRCINDESACGLSLHEYINEQYMQGIKQEIVWTKEYLVNHFNL